MSDTTTTESDVFQKAKDAYEACDEGQQAKLRLFACIMTVMGSGATDDEKSECLAAAIDAYSADVMILAAKMLRKGEADGNNVSVGVRVLYQLSRLRGKERYSRLIKMVEALPLPAKQEG